MNDRSEFSEFVEIALPIRNLVAGTTTIRTRFGSVLIVFKMERSNDDRFMEDVFALDGNNGQVSTECSVSASLTEKDKLSTGPVSLAESRKFNKGDLIY